jgi:HAD superfamily hydrolase (TIGR01490 family)
MSDAHGATGARGAAGAAFFDVDGTLMRTNITQYYVHIATRGFSPLRRFAWMLGVGPTAIYYLLLDKMSRGAFNRVFYRNYRGLEAARVRALAEEVFTTVMQPRLYPAARAAIAAHRARGERVVLVTGSIDFLIAPLARHLGVDAANTIAVTLAEENGRFTGELTGPPLSDEGKARAVRAYAAREGVDLAAATAYGDSGADLPMLAAVGHAVVVNPKPKLARLAREHGWRIEAWTAGAGSA